MPPDTHPTARYYEDLDCWVVWGDTARSALENRRLSSRTFDVANLSYLPTDMHDRTAHLTKTLRRWFALLDGAEHLAARRTVQPLFSPRKIRGMAGAIHTIVEGVLAEFDERGSDDAATDLANHVSARVVAHVLGLSDIEDATLHGWAGALSDFLATSYRRDCAERAQQALWEMEEFINARATEGGIWAASDDEDTDRLATSSMILFGGLETTSALVSFSLWYMLGHGLQDEVAASETGEEATAIVERALELYAPLAHVARIAVEDTDLAGCPIARDQLVLVSLSGHDLFDAPPLVDRPAPHCEHYRADHLAFGYGLHYCVGAPLARLAATTALTLFARRHPEARVREVRWRKNRTYRGFAQLNLDLK